METLWGIPSCARVAEAQSDLVISVLWQIYRLRNYPHLEEKLKDASVEHLTLSQLIVLCWDIAEVLRERESSVVN